MTAPGSIDPARFLHGQLASASPDLLRSMLTTFINTLMSAGADAICGAPYGESLRITRLSRSQVSEMARDLDAQVEAFRTRPLAPAQPRNVDPPAVHRVIRRPMTTAMPWRQRQRSQAPDRAVCAQHRISQLRQLISAGGQAGMKVPAEPRQHGECEWPCAGILWQSVHHGLRW